MPEIHNPLIVMIIIGLLVFSLFPSKILNEALILNFLHRESTENEFEYLPIKVEDNQQSSVIESDKSGWKTYVNHQAKFKIDYPQELYVIEDFTEEKLLGVSKVVPNYEKAIGYDKLLRGRVMFCAQNITRSQNYCHQGLQILYGIPISDGWGGGCDGQYLREIQFNSKKELVCDTQSRIFLLYADHPDYEIKLSLSLNFADNFARQTGLSMLDSFEFLIDSAEN